jgi:RNA polymerase sigma factor, sigma-70 family
MPTLIDLIHTDRTEALSKIYQEYRTEFIAWAIKNYGCSADEAKDSYQNAIIILYENVVSGKLTELNSSAKTYLFAVGKNKIRELKRHESKKEVFDQATELPAEEEQEVFTPEAVQLALNSLEQLGEPCKSLLQEFYYHKSTMTQIMEKLGYKNEDTAKNQKYKCLVRLRKIYNELQVKTS